MTVTTDPRRALAAAIDIARAGDADAARQILREIIDTHPQEHRAWLWLAHLARSTEEKRGALRHALELRRDDQKIRHAFMELMEARYVCEAAAKGVFLSYSRGDELLAVELADALRAANLPIWLDVTDIPAAADWHSEVQNALTRCGVMVMILSQDAIEDEAVQAERRKFAASGKIIVPLLYQHCEHEHLQLWHPVIDFRTDVRVGTKALIRVLTGE
jgi:hypothetical protein